MINVAIIGNGSVVSDLIDAISKDNRIKVSKIFVRSNISGQIFTNSINDIANDKTIDLVIEAISGHKDAKKFAKKIISSGKHYITCNKELVRRKNKMLCSLANKNGVTIYFNSIVSSSGIWKEEYDLPAMLTSYNILNHLDKDLFGFRGGGSKETAYEIYKDILNCMEDYCE